MESLAFPTKNSKQFLLFLFSDFNEGLPLFTEILVLENYGKRRAVFDAVFDFDFEFLALGIREGRLEQLDIVQESLVFLGPWLEWR